MNKNIRKILDDLYRLDPEFKKYEKQLGVLVAELLSAKPEVKMDSQFVKKLKKELLKSAQFQHSNQDNFFIMNKFYYLAGGIAVVAIIAILPFASQLLPKTISVQNEGTLLDNELTITQIANQSFGTIAVSGSASAVSANASEISSAPRGMGGGGGTSAVSYDAKIMPPYESINYKYVYKGDEIKLENAELEVYKRIKGDSSGQLSSMLSKFNLGLLDLNKFNDAQVQNISLSQNKPFGLYVYLYLNEGSIMMSQNWEMWPQSKCTDESCYANYRIKENEVLPDNELIDIANAFLKEYKVGLKNYGSPLIQDTWRVAYLKAEDKSNFYIPEVINVVYPLLINGKEVFEAEGTTKVGINVGIYQKEKKVSNLYNLMTLDYQSSAYPAITDFSKITNQAEQGGIYAWSDPNAKKTLEVEIGTPRQELVRIWKYENNRSEELLVPALIFPVTKKPEGVEFYKDNVVVPLIDGLVNDQPVGIMAGAATAR